jgi:integrase
MSHQLTPTTAAQLARRADIGQAANAVAAEFVLSDYLSRKSENTLRRHKADLASFAEYLVSVSFAETTGPALMREPAAWHGLTWGIVEGFKQTLVKAGFAIATINARLSTVKIYADLASRAGSIEASEAAFIRGVSGYRHAEGHNLDQHRETSRVGSKKEAARLITSEQAAALLARSTDTPQGRRDRLLLSLFIHHGLRVSEAARLTVQNFYPSDYKLHFYRPKTKSQAIPHKFEGESLEAMLAYLRNDAPSDGPAPLLRKSRKSGELGSPGVSVRAINAHIGRLGDVVGITGLSPHDLRHYSASRSAAEGASVRELMDFYGWTSAATAMRYVEAAEVVSQLF